MKTRTIISIIIATATVVLGTILFVTKLRKKQNCGCELAGTEDCIGGEDCDCDGTEEPYCETACCYDADACTNEEDDYCAPMAADKVEPEASEKIDQEDE